MGTISLVKAKQHTYLPRYYKMAPRPYAYNNPFGEAVSSIGQIVNKEVQQLTGEVACYVEGKLRKPTLIELLDFDTDCNTYIESLGFECGWIWWPILILFVIFLLVSCAQNCGFGGNRPRYVAIFDSKPRREVLTMN